MDRTEFFYYLKLMLSLSKLLVPFKILSVFSRNILVLLVFLSSHPGQKLYRRPAYQSACIHKACAFKMPKEFPYWSLIDVMPVEFPLLQRLHVTIDHRELPGIHKDSSTVFLFSFLPPRSWLLFSNSTLKDLTRVGVSYSCKDLS